MITRLLAVPCLFVRLFSPRPHAGGRDKVAKDKKEVSPTQALRNQKKKLGRPPVVPGRGIGSKGVSVVRAALSTELRA
jgi:hypothetical protein